MSKSKAIPSALLVASRMDLREAFREEIKRLGINKVDMTSDADQALESLHAKPRMLLVVDWELGRPTITKVMDDLRDKGALETRSVILVGKSLDPELIAIGCEYSVNHLHTGEISRNRIRDILEHVNQYEENQAPLREVLSGLSEARKSGKLESVVTALEDLQQKLSTNPRVAIELSELYIEQQRWTDAIAILEKWEHLQPPNVRVIHLLGRCFMKIKKHERAFELYSRASVLNPYHADRLVDIGQTLMKLNRFPEARESFQNARSLDPRNKGAVEGEGACALVEGDVNEALALLKESNPRDLASVFNTSAVLSMRQGRYEHGMSLYETSMNLVGEERDLQARLMFNKGVGYQRWGKPREAGECFEEAHQLDPNFEKAARRASTGGMSRDSAPPVEDIAEESLLTQPQQVIKPDADIRFGEGGDLDDDLDDDFGF